MAKTLITDDFEDNTPDHVDHGEPHNIVYGANGFTDVLDDETIALLVRAGIIVRDRHVAGPGWQTRIYVSVKGKTPK